MEKQLHVICAFNEKFGCDLYGFMNEDGKKVISPKYWCAHEFSEGLAAVGFVDDDGEAIDRLGFIDMNGNWVIAPRFSGVISCGFTEGLCAVIMDDEYDKSDDGRVVDLKAKKDEWGFIDKSGEFVIAPKYFDAGPFFNGVAPVSIEKEGMREHCGWGFIDKNGREIVPLEYDMPSDKPYHTAHGLLHLERNGEDFSFDLTGRQIWPK